MEKWEIDTMNGTSHRIYKVYQHDKRINEIKKSPKQL